MSIDAKQVIAARYAVQKKLGAGLIAASYLAYDRHKNEQVVLKVLSRTIFRDAELWSKVRVQLRKVTQLKHPHIVPILRGGQDDDMLYWVQPYLMGGSLADKLREQPFDTTSIHALLPPIASALAYANKKGIVHAHLQPSNILFDMGGMLKIVDFSLLAIADIQVTATDAVYVSPEQQLDHLLPLDSRVDIYALGGILFQLVNGQPPFSAESAEALAKEHLSTPVPCLYPTNRYERLKGRVKQKQQHWHNQPLAPVANYQTHQPITNAAMWQPLLEQALAKKPDQRFATFPALVKALPTSIPSRRKLSPLMMVATIGLMVGLLSLFLFNRNFHVAQFASPLRNILGVERVTQLEEAYLTVTDQSSQVRLSVGLAKPSSPWKDSPPPPTVAFEQVEAVLPAVDAQPVENDLISDSAHAVDISEQPLAISFSALEDLSSFGNLDGEGVWQPYLQIDNQLLAQRTFLQPDLARPLSIGAIVAFDLDQLSLHYVWGSSEPVLPNGRSGSGKLVVGDRPKTIAAFNGGFLSEHGDFGARSGGLDIPARDGLATVAIDTKGKLAIGSWGESLDPNRDWVAWRQNAQLILQDGQIMPAIDDNTITKWGGSIDGNIVTWRSALGINRAGNILYYVAGPGLSMDALARTLQTAGADTAMLLDINAYWVHFTIIQDGVVHALFPKDMALHLERYLQVSERDFFYLTVDE